MPDKKIVCEKYEVILEEPILYVDNESRRRSGHMTHAMAQFAPNSFIDFNSNCSAVRHGGHSAFGWIEYRISNDNGATFSEVFDLPYSKEELLDGVYSISVEKAVACGDGSIVAFCLRNSVYGNSVCCTPWATPTYIKSTDGGKTWSSPKEFSKYPGRIYGAVYHDGAIYAIEFCNDDFIGKKDDDLYRLFKSTDNGETFFEVSTLPVDSNNLAYCNIIFDKQNRLHFYAYNVKAEDKLEHLISENYGDSWSHLEPCFLDKGIRNPQIGYVDGVYILHGRAGGVKGFVLYTSTDATNFSKGTMLIENDGAYCYYSNNITLEDEKGQFLLMQYSDTYEGSCRVNVWHQKIRIKK